MYIHCFLPYHRLHSIRSSIEIQHRVNLVHNGTTKHSVSSPRELGLPDLGKIESATDNLILLLYG